MRQGTRQVFTESGVVSQSKVPSEFYLDLQKRMITLELEKQASLPRNWYTGFRAYFLGT
ncbi:hypothetical protein vB_PsyM_KIL4_0156 [Pseudomonas phage vB_PsyM_KIL4]|uniref:Uncharacterized protein n=2 Tax=Flaumdravirus TaxID=2560133 RepID=A0A142IF75_9CAUD|nr:hypothetical protein FDI83_gp057 [Pseudomonas phage vB_PsyM_KIL4]AMR57880.1 hypothetical protein vB_PsyM_KIL4_0156 [Pseudomonas phage vB_PsyM_KIL4]AMR58049.1 hypothetical protein vB_PsyM_KIL5_0158 [Pseudomonas phage vB_PsyM_KIL5]